MAPHAAWGVRGAARHPVVDAIDRAAEELIERADRHEATMALRLADGEAMLPLGGWRELFDTPGEALATMVRRSTTIVHGSGDTWVDPDESALLIAASSGGGNAPSRQVVAGADHDLASGRRGDDRAHRRRPRRAARAA